VDHRKRLLLGACCSAAGGLAVVGLMHAWAEERCEWLGEALSAPLLLGAAGLAVAAFVRRRRWRWLLLGSFLVLIAADTTLNLGARLGVWLLDHPARPIHRLDRAIPGLHLYTWPEMVLEAALLLLALPLGLAVLWDLRRDRAAALALVAAGCLSAFLFVVLLAGSGGGRHVPFGLGG